MHPGCLVCPCLGGPLMTVESVKGSIIKTVWFDHGAGPFRREYDVRDLRIV